MDVQDTGTLREHRPLPVLMGENEWVTFREGRSMGAGPAFAKATADRRVRVSE